MISLKFHPEAYAELLASAMYYEKQQKKLGKRFLEAFEHTIHQVRIMPKIYQKITQNIRRCCIYNFPYGIVFREKERLIEIIAVIPFRKKPGYWKSRV
jgi:toxin ParE1/3/4